MLGLTVSSMVAAIAEGPSLVNPGDQYRLEFSLEGFFHEKSKDESSRVQRCAQIPHLVDLTPPKGVLITGDM